jgi:phosphohistidine phosphatase
MQLILWRHAQAHEGSPDLERALTARGHRDAAKVAAWLRPRLPQGPVTVLCSPAQRTRQTAQALGLPLTIDAALAPGADVEAVLHACGWPQHREATVIAVGHQPWIGAVVAGVVGGVSASWAVRKGAFWWLQARPGDARGEVRVNMVLSPEALD